MTPTDEATYPCPACGARLFGWTAAHDPIDRGRKIVLDRCEVCGMAVTRAPGAPDPDLELAAMLERLDGGELEVTVPNRRSIQSGIGGAQWAGLEPELRRLHLTPDALRRLLAKRGYELGEVKTPFTREARRLMWQTLVNAFTLRDNFHRNAKADLIPQITSKDRWAYRLDRLVTVLVAIPAGLFGYPLEALGALLGRGGVIEATATRTTSREYFPPRSDLHPGEADAKRSISPESSEYFPPRSDLHPGEADAKRSISPELSRLAAELIGYAFGMEGFGGMFGDPDELQARLGELADSMQGAQKVAFADQAIQLAVTMTVAAIGQIDPDGNSDQQATQIRDAIRMIFPEAVTLVSEARQGLS